MSTADWGTVVGFVKDGVTIAAALVAIYVALAGLGAWRKQLAGTTEYEAARRLLKATYTLRGAINTVRSPFMSGGEIAHAMKQAGEDPTAQLEPSRDAIVAAYQARWNAVTDAISNLAAEAFEAEVLWGDDVQSLLKPLTACVADLYDTLDMLLRPEPAPARRPRPYEEQKRIDDTVYGRYDSDTNEFSIALRAAIQPIEQYLRPHLTKHPAKEKRSK